MTIRTAFFLFLFLFSTITFAATIQGRVVSIHDGDTLKISAGNAGTRTVRLLGTDTPEVDFNGHSQGEAAFAARDFLRSILPIGATVTVVVNDEEITDKNGRLLGRIFYENTDLNEVMLKEGWAAFYLIAPYDKTMAKTYSEASRYAFEAGRGIFSSRYSDVMMPYQFRMFSSGQKGNNLVGNIETKKLYSPDQVNQVPPYARVFFQSQQIANSRGFF